MDSVVFYGGGGLALIAAAARALWARSAPPNPCWRYLTTAIATFGAALAVTAQATLVRAASIEPFPNATRLLGDALVMTSAFCLATVVAHATSEHHAARRIRWHVIGLLSGITAMTVLLLVAHPRFSVEFAFTDSPDPRIVAYIGIFLTYMAWTALRVLALVSRYARAEDAHPLMRRGFQLTLAAAGTGLLWAGWKLGSLVLMATTGLAVPLQARISEGLSTVAIITGVIGCVFATSAPAIADVRARWCTWRAYHALDPLWTVLTASQPQVHLAVGASVGAIDYRLYRRIIEIRDAQFALRPWIPPELPRWVADIAAQHALDPPCAQLIAEAAGLIIALNAHNAGYEQPTNASEIVIPSAASGVADLLAEARWLTEVHRAMRRDPVVAELRVRGERPHRHCPDPGCSASHCY